MKNFTYINTIEANEWHLFQAMTFHVFILIFKIINL